MVSMKAKLAMKNMLALRPLLAVIAAGLLAACSGRSADESFASAKLYIEKGDAAAAIVELKNTLQSEPDRAEARFLLGKSLLDKGDPVPAAVELRKAQSLKYADDEVVPLLARALLESGETRKVVELDKLSTLTQPGAVASLKTSVALAYAALGNSAQADAAVAEALRTLPDFSPALLFRARVLAGQGDFDGAMKLVDGVLVRAPADADAMQMRGDLLRSGKGDVAGALEQYRKVVALKPDSVDAHSALIAQFLAKSELDAARVQLEMLKKHRPRHPRTLYFEARLASMQGDTKLANELAQDLLKVMPDSIEVLQLAGVVAVQKGELRQAEQSFSKIVQLAPSSVGARLLLARVLLQAGDYQRVLDTLKPIVESTSPDAEALSMAGTALLATGEARKAEELLSRAVKLKPQDATNRTALAQARLARGDLSGLGELEAIARTDSGPTADMALISANVRRRNFDAALKAVDQLAKKQPGTPQPAHLRAQILVMRGDLAGAREAYGQALAVDGKFFPSISGLAALDLRENKPDRARERFDALLKADEKNTQAMVALARLDDRAGKPSAEVAAMLTRAIAASPSDAVLRQTLVQFLLQKGDAKAALVAAQSAATALPESALALESLARAHLAAGEIGQARSTYGRLASLLPTSPEPQIGLASTFVSLKDYAAATDSLKRALAVAPDHPRANEMAVAEYIRAGRQDEAEALVRKLLSRRPDAALGYALLGSIEMSRKKWDAAATAYESALKLQRTTNHAQWLHAALWAGGKRSRADELAATWLKQSPNDAAFVFYLGGVALNAKEYGLAEAVCPGPRTSIRQRAGAEQPCLGDAPAEEAGRNRACGARQPAAAEHACADGHLGHIADRQ
jgi:cellulose synthase operon protein C